MAPETLDDVERLLPPPAEGLLDSHMRSTVSRLFIYLIRLEVVRSYSHTHTYTHTDPDSCETAGVFAACYCRVCGSIV